MGDIGRGLLQAVRLIVSLDPGTYEALGTSLRVTMSALFWSALAGFPLGILLAFSHFRGKQGVMNVVYTLMGFPPVVAGLLVYLLFSRSGPLGVLQLLYTPTAMVVAQIALALPVIVGLSVLGPVSYTHLRAHETRHDLVCRLLLEKKKKKKTH